MRKHLVALLIAASVAALPSHRAEARSADEVIAGLAALAIAGAVLAHGSRARDDGHRGRDRAWRYAPPRHGGYLPRRHGVRRGHLLPAWCRLPGRHGRGFYGARCLQSAGIRLDRLPRGCVVPLRGRGLAIDGRCLERPFGRR